VKTGIIDAVLLGVYDVLELYFSLFESFFRIFNTARKAVVTLSEDLTLLADDNCADFGVRIF
jgi:hypothetical protein